MDVRQFAFLARQPSAALKNREHFLGLPKRGLAFILANAMFWQPLLAQADGIVVNAPGTTLGQAGNGVPIVNIAAPNAQGLSHNQFSDYNVGANGVILNNATNRTQSTQLGGIILGNPNFNGAAANVILNEVNGGSPSQLRGYTEVAGQSAHVIVANPYGISCNGCGFINTPQATLTTGKAVITNGQVTGYQVDQGSVSIDGAGLNASNIDQFEIITRAATINAQINANQLTVIAGRNDVDAHTLKATARADDGSSKPQVAIDSSVLGGMYAGAIKLVGTEAGVGVKLAGNLAASGGDIQLDANGQLSMAQATASGAVNVKAASLDAQGPVYAGSALNVQTTGDLNSQNNLAARDSITLNSGGQLTNHGIIEAGVNADNTRNSTGDVSVTAQNVVNTGQSVIASRDLSVTATQTLGNQGGTLSGQRKTTVTAGTLDNQNKGRVLSADSLSLTVDTVLNAQGGLIKGQNTLTATLGHLNNNTGEVSSQGNSTLVLGTMDNLTGLVMANNVLDITATGAVNNQNGRLGSNNVFIFKGQSLDNTQKGRITAQQRLDLTAARLDNNGGSVITNGSLTLTGSTLDNSGGKLSAQSGLVITLDAALTNQLSGLISSEGTLTAHAASLDNSGGSFSSAGQLSLTSDGALINQGGRLVTDGGIDLHSASLDNRQSGTISGQGPVSITTGAFDNSHSGFLSSGDRLDLTSAQLTNQDGGRIGAKDLSASVSGLDQQGGSLKGDASLTLDLNHGQLNNQGGLINAPLLVLNNLKGVNNQGGEISSAQAFTLAAESLSNDNGKLLSNQALTLRIDQALSNIKGMIAAASVDAHVGSLDNSGGTLTSRADLGLTVDGQLTNQSLGLINATTGLTINSAGINNQGGSLLGSAIALDFGSATGDLNNAAGKITTAGNLTINHLRDLNNQGGELTSVQSINLTARTLDNSNGGKLISNNQLTLTAGNLINQNGGLLSGWQGVTLTGTSLDNSNNGTVSSRSGNVDVTLSGALLNGNAGAVASQQVLTIKAGSLDNSAGSLSSAGAQSLTVTGLLNNGQGGLIDSGAALTLNAMALNNSGTVQAQQALTFTGTYLDNSNGTLSGGAAVTLDLLGALTNTKGTLSGTGPLVVQRSTQINNQGGELSSQSLLTLLTGGLDSSNGGLVSANDKLLITSTGTVQNGYGGLIASRNGDLQLTATSLGNGKGSLQGKGAVSLDVSGDIDNQSGKVIAQDGDLLIKAASLDSRGGLLSSISGALTTRVVGVLRNGYDLNNNGQGGQIQAQRLDLQAWGGIDNNGGRIAAQTGDTVIATGAGNFDNRNGALHAKGLVQVSGHNFDNSGDNDGQISGAQITLGLDGALNNRLGIIESDSTLSITAASLDNQTGQLRALGGSGKTEFQISGLFDNSNGKLETANSDLTLGVGSFMNQGGSVLHTGTGIFDTATVNLINAGGSLVTRGGLTLTADDWTNSSVIQVGRLTVNVKNLTQTGSGQLLATESFAGSGVSWSNDGLIASDGTASLNLSGNYSGNGRYTSLGTLGLTAAQVNLSSSASIAGGGDTTISVAGLLNSYGRLTSAGGMSVSAGSINNYGTLGSNGNLLLSTPSLLNQDGLIFSGGDTALQANSFTNHSAQLYSFGAVSIDGYGGAAQAAEVINISGALESTGKFSINAANFENRTESFALGRKLVSGTITLRCLSCSGSYYDLGIAVRETYEGQDNDISAAASLSAGGDFVFRGGNFLNSKSTVSAGGDITIQADNLKNVGAVGGTIERTRIYRTLDIYNLTAASLAYQVTTYNSRNDPDYPNIYYINDSGGLSRALAETYERSGPDGSGAPVPTVRFRDPITGQVVTTLALGSHYGQYQQSQYDRNNLVALPSQLQSYVLTSDVEVAKDGSASGRSAVIQAGGNVSISATQDLNNSVIHQDYGFSAGANKVQGTQVSGTGAPVLVRLNAQLPPDLAQQQVNPLALPGFSLPTGQNGLFRLSGQSGSAQQGAVLPDWDVVGSSIGVAQRQQGATGSVVVSGADSTLGGQSLARVQGLPDTSAMTRPQKYLIETNPALTDLKQFMSSDYLLSNLGYNPDTSAKRLGDGFYEQKLIQQAVVARTGQRFIDGQTSNETLFKYLMDNAISSKQQLDLSVGVSLTAQQVAALTHDIVWMEKQVVNGEEVLVPVLYLAQATNRLAPNGALIQGADVTLIAGANLENSGTLRASNSLSAAAGKDLLNTGLVEAGNRLDLLAGNSIVNKAGGIIAGRDVSLTAVSSDVLNERTVTTATQDFSNLSHREDYLDSAARIEAANNLTLQTGRDVTNSGSVMQSGGNTFINAGRDINIAATEILNSNVRGSTRSSSVTQNEATVSAGLDLQMTAGRDLTVVASQIDAKRDISMAATENLTLTSAGDESHYLSKSRKETTQRDHVSQVATTVQAGGDVNLSAGKDLGLIASKVSAGNEAYLVAGDRLDLLSAQNSDYSLYDMKKRGSWGSKKTQHDEVTQVTNVGSEIKTGGDLTLKSGSDQHYQVAKLESGKDLTIESGGDITFEGQKDLHQESHEKSNSSLAWMSMKGEGHTDETFRQSQMVAKGQLTIKAVDGLKIDIKQVNQQTVSQAVDAMVAADPSLAWLKKAEAQGNVDWRRVEEIHQSFKYQHSGLGAGAQLILAILLAAVTGGAGAALVGAAEGSITATIANVAFVSLENTAANSAISNKGNLGAVVKDTFSSDSLKSAAISGLTAGFTQGVIDSKLGGTTKPFNNLTKGFDLSTLDGIGGFAIHAAAQGVAAGAIKTAISGGSLSENLQQGLVTQAGNVVAATVFNFVGSYAQDHWQVAHDANDTTGMELWKEGGVARTAMHALFGGAVSSATGGDFKSGAIAAGASQAMAGVLNETFDKQPELRQAFSQIVGLTASGLAGGDVDKASWVAQMADGYNRQLHQKETLALEKLQAEDPDNALKLKAAACALVHCSASVPPEDPRYNDIVELERYGADFKNEQKALVATGAFDEYGRWDKANDSLLRDDETIQRTGAAQRAVLGAAGAVGGFGTAVATTPACITGAGCALPILSGLGGLASFDAGWTATGELFAPYDYTQGSKVLASFSSDTYPGDVNPMKDYGTAAARAAIEAILFKGVSKYANGSGASVLVEGVEAKAAGAGAKEPAQIDSPPVKNGWNVGDDVYNQTAKGNDPSWSAVRSRFWKNEASAPDAANTYGPENLDRMSKGLAPQRYNADKGGVESMELSHEPIPARDGGKDFVPRWPQDHAAVDPYRKPGY